MDKNQTASSLYEQLKGMGYVKAYLEDVLCLPTSRRKFTCLNPDHDDTHPSMSYDKKNDTVHCFSCGKTYDLPGIIEVTQNCSKSEALRKACEFAGIKYDAPISALEAPQNAQEAQGAQQVQKPRERVKLPDDRPKTRAEFEAEAMRYDFTEAVGVYAKPMFNDLIEGDELRRPCEDYLLRRGLNMGTVADAQLAYIPGGVNELLQRVNKKLVTADPMAKYYTLCLPNFDENGRCFSIQMETEERGVTYPDGTPISKYKNIKGLPRTLYNERYIRMQDPPKVAFICEGVYDALSIEQCGGNAIALCGAQNTQRLEDLLRAYQPATNFVIVPDADGPGEDSAQKVKEILTKLRYQFEFGRMVTDRSHDANEYLQEDPQQLQKLVSKYKAEMSLSLEELERAQEERKLREYEQLSNLAQLGRFHGDIEGNALNRPRSTGFPELDKFLEGGLQPRLYVLGAISGLGKTTFCLQIADHMAAAGNDVLYISLEMSPNELMAKSLSRETALSDMRINHEMKNASTASAILTGKVFREREPMQTMIYHDAERTYSSYAGNIYTVYQFGKIGPQQIQERLQQHVEITGQVPIVIIDYVQILQGDPRKTDKQNTDDAILAIKDIAQNYKTPVIAISSFNRENYSAPVSLSAFKESGGLEYSSDLCIGLQYHGMDYIEGEKDAHRTLRIRQLFSEMESRKSPDNRPWKPLTVECKILKNRFGRTGSVHFDFWPMFGLYQECLPAEQQNRRNGVIDFEDD